MRIGSLRTASIGLVLAIACVLVACSAPEARANYTINGAAVESPALGGRWHPRLLDPDIDSLE